MENERWALAACVDKLDQHLETPSECEIYRLAACSFIEAALRARNLHSLSILGLRDSEYRSVNWNLLAGLNYLQTLHVDIDVRRGRPVPSNLLALPQLRVLGLKLDRPEVIYISSQTCLAEP